MLPGALILASVFSARSSILAAVCLPISHLWLLCDWKTPNDPKLSDRDPEARVCAKRREAKARHVPGFMAGAHAVTEPGEPTAAHR